MLAWMPSGVSSMIATEQALVLPAGSAPERLAWDLVLRASWEPDSVEVISQDVAGGRPLSRRIAVESDPGVLPHVVRERVMASIVVQHHVALDGERGARMVARREAGSTDLRWSVVFDAGLDPADPVLRARADEALAEVRASLGI
ncbi:unannotated protein [freshwater metagenome]|uniref:Unannotated protein n=1 Tax=freshwater metagenome TaxID=449393 RepID=A0A6J7ICK4_9ZZZZ